MTGQTRTLRRYTLLLLGLLWCAAAAAGDEIAVIVGRDAAVNAITPVMLRDIYLKKVFLDADGQSYNPVNLPPENPLRLSLAETVFHKSARQLQDYWNQRYFQGITPPYVLRSQEAVLQFVAKTPGAIGYIASCRLDSRVKAVLRFRPPSSQRAALERMCGADRPTEQPE